MFQPVPANTGVTADPPYYFSNIYFACAMLHAQGLASHFAKF
jgi:hypothetical protein